jgi:hypothetical protein
MKGAIVFSGTAAWGGLVVSRLAQRGEIVMSTFWTRGRDSRAESENATAAGVRARIWRLTAVDRCDRCGAQAYVRVLLPGRLELLFCAHHNRQYASALANIAVEIQDETMRLACCALCGILAIRFANQSVARHSTAAKATTRFTPTDTSGAASRQNEARAARGVTSGHRSNSRK